MIASTSAGEPVRSREYAAGCCPRTSTPIDSMLALVS